MVCQVNSETNKERQSPVKQICNFIINNIINNIIIMFKKTLWQKLLNKKENLQI